MLGQEIALRRRALTLKYAGRTRVYALGCSRIVSQQRFAQGLLKVGVSRWQGPIP